MSELRLRQTVAVAALFLRRYLPNPLNLSYTLLMPVLIALIFGTADARATSTLPIGAVGSSAAAAALVTAVDGEKGVEIHRYGDRQALVAAVVRGDVVAGLVVTDDGGAVRLVGATEEPLMLAVRGVVESVATRQGVRIETPANVVVGELTTTQRGHATGIPRAAAGMLVFCVLLNVMNSASLIADDRGRGVFHRLASAPTPASTVVVGELGGRFVLGALQCIVVAGVSSLLFGTVWGDALPFGLITIALSASATGAAVLLGVSVKSSGQQASVAAHTVAAVLALLGGSFWSLDVVPTAMRFIGHVSPTAWALDAFDKMIAQGAGAVAIAPQIAVLAGFTFVLVAGSARVLRRAMVRPRGA